MTDELPPDVPTEPTPTAEPTPTPAPAPDWPPAESGSPWARAQVPARPRLPGRVTAAAVVLLVFGTLAAFGSVMTLLWSLFALRRFDMWFDGGMMVPGMDPLRGGGHMGFDSGSMGWAGFASFGLMLLIGIAVSGGHLAAGWAILQRLEWGRILGMVVSGVALVVLVLGVVGMLGLVVGRIPDFSAFDDRSGYWIDWYRSMLSSAVAFGAVVSLALGLLYGFVLWVLARAADVFD